MAIPAEPGQPLCAGAPAPLPMDYPANLIYAQNMLSMSLSQLQRVETQKSQLQLLLHEHESIRLKDTADSVLTALKPAIASLTSAIGRAHGEGAAAEQPGILARWFQRREQARAAQEAAAAAVAANAAAAAPAPDVPGAAEGLRQHRRRLALAVNLAVTMLIFEMSTGWFVVYFFTTFLYIAGIFDPLITWIYRHCARDVTLEQHLLNLRRRQQRPAVAEGGVPGEGVGGGGRAAAAGGGTAGTEAAPDAAGASSPDVGRAAAANRRQGGGAAAAPEELPHYGYRFFYQLVVMLFMTLVPWWIPDPRMVQ